MFHCYIIYISLWSVAAHFLLIFYEVWCLFSSNAFLWMFAPMFFSLIVSNLKRKYPAFNSGKILDTSCMEICRIFMVTGCHFNPKWKVTPGCLRTEISKNKWMILKCNKTPTWNTPHHRKTVMIECWHVFPEFHIHYFITSNWDYSKWPSNTFVDAETAHSLPTNVAELELKAPRIRSWRSIWSRMGSS